jgi:hypothetical protein
MKIIILGAAILLVGHVISSYIDKLVAPPQHSGFSIDVTLCANIDKYQANSNHFSFNKKQQPTPPTNMKKPNSLLAYSMFPVHYNDLVVTTYISPQPSTIKIISSQFKPY